MLNLGYTVFQKILRLKSELLARCVNDYAFNSIQIKDNAVENRKEFQAIKYDTTSTLARQITNML